MFGGSFACRSNLARIGSPFATGRHGMVVRLRSGRLSAYG